MSEQHICPSHDTIYGRHDTDWCPDCMADFEARPSADAMTGPARRDAMEALNGPLTIPFTCIHKRIEELVGRPVFTHELGMCWNALVAEAGSDQRGAALTPTQVVQPLIDAGKSFVTVRVAEGDPDD